jgi:hypothetical protein
VFGRYYDEQPVQITMNVFDFVKAITENGEDLIRQGVPDKEYIPFVVNRALSFGLDTVFQANEINLYPFLQKQMQFDFLRGVVRKKKRFLPWQKYVEPSTLTLIKQYYKYSDVKAEQALKLLTTEQIQTIKQLLDVGGTRNDP